MVLCAVCYELRVRCVWCVRCVLLISDLCVLLAGLATCHTAEYFEFLFS